MLFLCAEKDVSVVTMRGGRYRRGYCQIVSGSLRLGIVVDVARRDIIGYKYNIGQIYRLTVQLCIMLRTLCSYRGYK